MVKDQFPMLSVLHAEGPAADIKSQMMLYGQFVGSWQGRVVLHALDGKRGEAGGLWPWPLALALALGSDLGNYLICKTKVVN